MLNEWSREWMGARRVRGAVVSLLGCVLLAGCSRFKPKPADNYVYVTAKQTFLRDRVAAVSNRTGTVANGDRLKVLERGRRFVRVETAKGEIGWIDDKTLATQETYDAFDDVKKEHKGDPPVASAVVRDEVYMHLKPGRDTERFYRLTEGEKLQLLKRATLEKALPPGATKPRLAAAGTGKAGAAVPDAPAPPAMEDWWLVRDSQGRTGWLYGRMMDVDAPDALTRYAEGQRMVGAYLLGTVNDVEAPGDNKDIPEYVTVLSPYKAGLTYDFDQVRVFTWNPKMHRYETAFREKNIEGYLPLELKKMKDPYGKSATAAMELPGFTYHVLAADAPVVVPDPVTGAVSPGRLIAKTYRMEGNLVRRVVAPGVHDEAEAHPVAVEKKVGKGKNK